MHVDIILILGLGYVVLSLTMFISLMQWDVYKKTRQGKLFVIAICLLWPVFMIYLIFFSITDRFKR